MNADYLTFKIDERELAVPILAVKSVLAMPKTTYVPYMAPHFKGIFNLRGSLISLMDLRTKLGITGKQAPEDSSVVVIEHSRGSIGVIVDSIARVIPKHQIDEENQITLILPDELLGPS
jgi:purine-binding chemotaxis protein CheW